MKRATVIEDPMASPPLSVWGPRYFSRGWLSILTIPVFLLLIFATYSSAAAGIILWLAFGRAKYAVYGSIIGYLAFICLWPLALLPAFLCYSLLKNTPGLWLRHDVQMRTITKLLLTVGLLILLLALAQLLTTGESAAVAWVADRNPCAALDAGVTGSRPPLNCLDRLHAVFREQLSHRWLLVEPPINQKSPTTFVVDINAAPQHWIVYDDFETLEACQRSLAANRGKNLAPSELTMWPHDVREGLGIAQAQASQRAGCTFVPFPNTPIQ